MNNPIKTQQLEFNNSTFLIDLMKHKNGKLYIEVSQEIFESKKVRQTLKINPTLIPDLIKVLQSMYDTVPKSQTSPKLLISEADKQRLQDRYLKGVPLADLAMQFDLKQENIEMTLRNRNISVLSTKEEQRMKWTGKKGYRKKK